MKRALALSLSLFFCAASAPAAPNDAKEIHSVIEKTVNSVLDVLREKGLEKADRKRRSMAIAEPVFDFALMGKLTLGRTNWPKLSEPQKKEFIDLFVRNIEDSYYEKIDLFTDETVEFDEPVAGEKGKYEMTTRVVSKGQRYKLLYKVYKNGAAWRIYDMEIEGISLIRTYGAQYDQFLRKSSPAELLSKMKEKSLSAPKELKLSAKTKAEEKP